MSEQLKVLKLQSADKVETTVGMAEQEAPRVDSQIIVKAKTIQRSM